MPRPPPSSPLFPYTTLFRSPHRDPARAGDAAGGGWPGPVDRGVPAVRALPHPRPAVGARRGVGDRGRGGGAGGVRPRRGARPRRGRGGVDRRHRPTAGAQGVRTGVGPAARRGGGPGPARRFGGHARCSADLPARRGAAGGAGRCGRGRRAGRWPVRGYPGTGPRPLMTPPPGDHTTPTGWRLVRAGTDAVPAWVRQFFQIRRPGVRRRRWLTVVAVLALTGLTGWLLAATPLLAVQEVRVTGTTILSPAQVREVVAVPEQTPLLRVPVDEVADRVRGLAAVARVEVYREWPDTLVVEIVERVPAA